MQFSLFISIYASFGLIGRPRKREADTKKPGRCLLFFWNELSGSFTYPMFSTETWDLGLKSRPNDLVGREIKRTTPGLTIQHAVPRPRSAGKKKSFANRSDLFEIGQ